MLLQATVVWSRFSLALISLFGSMCVPTLFKRPVMNPSKNKHQKLSLYKKNFKMERKNYRKATHSLRSATLKLSINVFL